MSSSIPVRLCSNSPVRWVSLPRPLVPYAISPGRCLASAINCASVVTPSEGAAEMNIGPPPRKPTGAKSRGTSIGRLAAAPGGTGRDAGRDGAAAARLIDRQDLLAPDLGQPVGDDPQDHIHRAAGPRVRDALHRPRGII